MKDRLSQFYDARSLLKYLVKQVANLTREVNGLFSPDRSITTNKSISVDNSNEGIILKSPNGNHWKVTVDNTGSLVITQVV